MKNLCDANIILRYLMHDDEEQYSRSKEIISKNPVLPLLVLAEVVYVLKSVYKIPKSEISDTLMVLADEVILEDMDLAIKSLQNFRETNLDFVDCYLLARNQIMDDGVETFDKGLNKHLGK